MRLKNCQSVKNTFKRSIRSLTTGSSSTVPRTTYSLQSTLPPLPIPSLQDTALRYLRSLLPLCTEHEHRETQRAVSEFIAPGGMGEFLQSRLKARATEHPNWLEQYWDNMYLELRDPIPINVPYVLQLKDVPEAEQKFPRGELQYASHVIHEFLSFQQLVDREELTPDMDPRGNGLCMNQFARLFGHARIPAQGRDKLKSYSAKPHGLELSHFATEHIENNLPTHVIIICKKQLYYMDVKNENGDPLPPAVIESQLQQIVEAAERQQPADSGIQAFTHANRDIWANARSEYEKTSPKNRDNLETTDRGLFVVCLDESENYGAGTSMKNLQTADDSIAHDLIVGESGSRWYDKHQLIISKGYKAGVTMEHSPGDATPVLKLLDFVVENLSHANPEETTSVPHNFKPYRLEFDTPTDITHILQEVTQESDRNRCNLNVATLNFTQFGATALKQDFKLPPDAFVQLAINCAWYKLYGTSTPQYESVATRSFLHGRTETMRTTSMESMLLAAALAEPRKMTEELHTLRCNRLTEALAAHQEYMAAAKRGNGVDRHLFGLKMLAMEAGVDPLPAIFTDTAFSESATWRLSTSNAGTPSLRRFGFGPVASDGYGIGYMIHPSQMMFSVSSFEDCQVRSMNPHDFTAALSDSLEQLTSLRK